MTLATDPTVCLCFLYNNCFLLNTMEQYTLKNMNSCWNTKISFYLEISVANVIKLFTVVIYCHFTVIPSFFAIKNITTAVAKEWQQITVVFFITQKESIINTAIYHGLLTLENVSTVVNYRGIFITLAPGGLNSNPYLNVAHFFNTGVNQKSAAALDSRKVSHTCCFIVELQ